MKNNTMTFISLSALWSQ